MYTIKLADGRLIENLDLNGNNYISDEKIDDSVFADNLSHVEVTNTEDGTVEKYDDMFLVQNIQVGHQFWFILEEKDMQTKAFEKIAASLSDNETSITNMEVALAEVFEMMVGGK